MPGIPPAIRRSKMNRSTKSRRAALFQVLPLEQRVLLSGSPVATPQLLSPFDAPYIAGIVWFDGGVSGAGSSDGIRNAGEDPIPLIEVDLQVDGSTIQSTVTDNNGQYAFINLPVNTYTVQFVAPFNYTISPKNAGPNPAQQSFANPLSGVTDPININGGETDGNIGCGMFTTPAPVIEGTVFNDLNGDGTLNPNERGLPNVLVSLFIPGPDGIIGDSDDVLIATTRADANGAYSFPNGSMTIPSLTTLNGGQDYYVNFQAPATFFFSPQQVGASPTLYSWADQTTGDTFTLSIPLNKDRAFTTVNCGMFQETLSISGPIEVISPSIGIPRPHTGTTNATFNVQLLPANFQTVFIPFTTVDGPTPFGFDPAIGQHGATTLLNDYLPNAGDLEFDPGVTLQQVVVQIVGKTDIENDVTFFVDITDNYGFHDASLSASCTILNTNFATASIGNDSETRSSTSNVNFIFPITLSAPSPFIVEVDYSTQDFSAIQGKDFIAVTQGQVFIPAFQLTGQATVTGLPGTNPALSNQFHVNLLATSTVQIGTTPQGTGTIVSNVPAQVTVVGGQVTESLTGNALLPFTVTVTPSLFDTVTINYTTSDGTGVAGVDYAAKSGTLTFTPGNLTQTIYVTAFRRFLTQQDKTVNLTITQTNITNPGDTLAVPSPVGIGTIHDLPTVAEVFDNRNKIVYTDYLLNKVTIALKGLGSGTLVFLGNESSATDAYLILLNGTNADSALSMTTAGRRQTSFHAIQVNGPIGSIIGKNANLVTQVAVTGSLNTLQLNFVAASPITVGAGTGTLGLTFTRVLDTSITSGIPIRSLTAVDYLNTDGVPDLVTAPQINIIKIKGNFQGTLVSGSVNSVQVAGSIDGGSILATNRIGSVTAGSIIDSVIFAGVNSGVTALPTATDDFLNTTSRINSVTVLHNGSFSNSSIAAWNVGSLHLGSVQTTAGGATFGVSGKALASVKAFGDTPISINSLNDSTKDFTAANFVLTSV